MTKKKLVGLLAEGAVYGGAISVFTKFAQNQFPPLTFLLLRFVLALLVMVPYAQHRNEKFPILEWKKIALISLFFTANIVLFQFGVRHTTAISAQMLYAAIPGLTVLIAWPLLKEQPSAIKIFGIAIGFLGTAVIAVLPALGSLGIGSLRGNAIILLAVSSYTFYPVLTRKYLAGISRLSVLIGTAFTGLMLLAFVLLVNPEGLGWVSNVKLSGLISLLVVGILGTARYSLIYLELTQDASPLAASTLLYLQPLAAIFIAYPLLGEKPSWIFAIGAVLSLLGVWLITKEKQKTAS